MIRFRLFLKSVSRARVVFLSSLKAFQHTPTKVRFFSRMVSSIESSATRSKRHRTPKVNSILFSCSTRPDSTLKAFLNHFNSKKLFYQKFSQQLFVSLPKFISIPSQFSSSSHPSLIIKILKIQAQYLIILKFIIKKLA